MDYNNTNEHWDWQNNTHHTPKDSSHDMSEGVWNGVPQNEEDLSYMFDDETTPVKACGDLAYHVNHRDSRTKEPEEPRESFSQVKRRRMLQFDNEAIDPYPQCDELSSTFLKSNERVDSIDAQWISGFSENASASDYQCLEQSPDEWISECFNETEMNISPDELNFTGASDVHIDISKLCDVQPEQEANVIQKRVTRTPQNVVFRGRKSYIRTPTKLATSVAYPFAFIKPSGAHGDVTLKDINQRIRTPPPSKSKQKDEDPAAYPTSAFSGKPVVGKTKIRTEGGKGSITIMRTKG